MAVANETEASAAAPEAAQADTSAMAGVRASCDVALEKNAAMPEVQTQEIDEVLLCAQAVKKALMEDNILHVLKAPWDRVQEDPLFDVTYEEQQKLNNMLREAARRAGMDSEGTFVFPLKFSDEQGKSRVLEGDAAAGPAPGSPARSQKRAHPPPQSTTRGQRNREQFVGVYGRRGSKAPTPALSIPDEAKAVQAKGVKRSKGPSQVTDLAKKLRAMKNSELKFEAARLGLTQEEERELLDAEDMKAWLVEFIMSKSASPDLVRTFSGASSCDGESLAGSIADRQSEMEEDARSDITKASGRLSKYRKLQPGSVPQAPQAVVQEPLPVRPSGRPERQCRLNNNAGTSASKATEKRGAPVSATAAQHRGKSAPKAKRGPKARTRQADDLADDDGDAASIASRSTMASARKAPSVASKTSKASGPVGRGRASKAAATVQIQEELPKKPQKPPPPPGPAPLPAAPAPAQQVPSRPASEASFPGMGLENLLTQQAKDRLQNKIDMLNDQQLEQVLDFLEADVAQEDNDPDQEIQLDLDRLELPRMVALVRLIDDILNEAPPGTSDQAAASAAAASTPMAPPAEAAAAGKAQRVLPDAPPTDAIQNSFVSPGDTPLNSPRVQATRPSPSAVGPWSEFNARANLHERHKQAARESIAPSEGANTAASTAPANQAPPSGCFSMLHDAAEILHMMD